MGGRDETGERGARGKGGEGEGGGATPPAQTLASEHPSVEIRRAAAVTRAHATPTGSPRQYHL